MLSLSSQRTSFNIVVSDLSRCKSSIIEVCDKLCTSGFTYYMIVHDKDVDAQGLLKRTHLHLVLVSLKRYRVKQMLNFLCDVFQTNIENIQIDENLSIVASVQYLIHQNDVNKYQYAVSEVLTNNDNNLKALLLENITTNELTTSQLFDFILNQNLNRIELIYAIGIGKYQHYRNTINDIYEYLIKYEKRQ